MSQTPVTTDHQIQTAVIKELDWSPSIAAEHVGVAVTDGAVTLSGEVSSLPQKEAAVHAAMRVHGVTALANEIVVDSHDSSRNDADIARAATKVLADLEQLADSQITATVHEHVVSLFGTVDWHYQREAARKSVSSLAGVTEVVSCVAVRPTGTSIRTKAEIVESLVRGARSEGQQIDVDVSGHVATLRGQVHSWYEHREAERAAWSAPGITEVTNALTVTY